MKSDWTNSRKCCGRRTTDKLEFGGHLVTALLQLSANLPFTELSNHERKHLLDDDIPHPCAGCPSSIRRPLLIVVEGTNDVEFLVRLSRRLAISDPAIPNLQSLASAGRVVFIPFGGGNPNAWSDRLAPLGCPEFHLYDRESPPETGLRMEAASRVRARPGCRAFVTGKRALENYLHPAAIAAAGGGKIEFGPDDCVASVLARAWYQKGRNWSEIPWRAKSRSARRAKRWANTVAVEQMTPQLLKESDSARDHADWFETIAQLMEHK